MSLSQSIWKDIRDAIEDLEPVTAPIIHSQKTTIQPLDLTHAIDFAWHQCYIHPQISIELIENYLLFIHHAKQIAQRMEAHIEAPARPTLAYDFFEEAHESGKLVSYIDDNEYYLYEENALDLPRARGEDFLWFVSKLPILLIDEYYFASLIEDPEIQVVQFNLLSHNRKTNSCYAAAIITDQWPQDI